MIDTIGNIVHWISQICYIINPFMMIIACIMWMILYSKCRKELGRMYMRCYALEKQIDFVVNNRDVDREFFNYMTKTYKDLEEKING